MFGKLIRAAFLEKETRARWEAARADGAGPRVERKHSRPDPAPAAASSGGAPSGRDAGAADAAAPAARAPSRTETDVLAAQSAERRQLIHSAMTIYRMKQSALQDLDPDTRQRLRAMAEQMLGLDETAAPADAPAGAAGETDNAGGDGGDAATGARRGARKGRG